MAEKDRVEKLLEDYNDVFADIYNVLLFQEAFLKEEQLFFGPTESVYKEESGNLGEQRRDVLKTYLENNLCILSLGVENQSTLDDVMPIRLMGYDYATYRGMISNERSITPVITIVLNFSDKKWNKAKSLYELMEIPEKLRPFVQNYEIRVFDIAFLDDDVIESFTSDFKVVARFFKEKRLGSNQIMRDDCVETCRSSLRFVYSFYKR